jgi:TRAP-type uncharacterized transport system fused permease subunit
LTSVIPTIVAIFGLVFAVGGYINRNITLWERALFAVATGLILVPTVHIYSITGVIAIVVLVIFSIFVGRRHKKPLLKEV